MSKVGKNVVANLASQLWTTALGLALIPIYIRFLGVEAYGLTGFFASMQVMVNLLDLGLSTTANREVAKASARAGDAPWTRDMVRTLEAVYALTAIGIAVGIFLLAKPIAHHWISANTLDKDLLTQSVRLYGLILAVRWPVPLYTSIMKGLQKQLPLNIQTIATSTLRGLGAFLILAFVSRTIMAFLWWQAAVSVLETVLFIRMAWRHLPAAPGHRPTASRTVLSSLRGFTSGVALIAVFGVLLKHSDKLLITRLLSLKDLGYYTTAATASLGLTMLVNSIFSAVFPRITALVHAGDEASLAHTYHRSAQLIAFLICPIAAALISFPGEALALWTRSDEVARHAAIPLAFLALASMVNAMMQMPYALQLGFGRTDIALWYNGISLAVLTPLLFFLIKTYGIAGSACAWLAFNIAYYLIVPQVMHRTALRGHKARWYLRDTLPFMLSSLALFGAARWLAGASGGGLPAVFGLGALAAALYYAWALTSYPSLREYAAIAARKLGLAIAPLEP